MKMLAGVATIAVALVAVVTLSVVAEPIDKTRLPVTSDEPVVTKKADAPAAEEMYFELTEASMALWGCWAPCMCPIHLIGDMQGGFTLTETSRTDSVVEYAIEDIEWDVYDFHWGEGYLYTVTGSGTLYVYSGMPKLATQQVILDLEFDGQSDQFDSGEIPYSDLDSLSFTVANNGFVCLNDAFTVEAVLVEEPETISQDESASLSGAAVSEIIADTSAEVQRD